MVTVDRVGVGSTARSFLFIGGATSPSVMVFSQTRTSRNAFRDAMSLPRQFGQTLAVLFCPLKDYFIFDGTGRCVLRMNSITLCVETFAPDANVVRLDS